MSLKLNAWIEADTLPLGMAALHAIKAEVDADNEASAARIAELTEQLSLSDRSPAAEMRAKSEQNSDGSAEAVISAARKINKFDSSIQMCPSWDDRMELRRAIASLDASRNALRADS